MPADDTTFISNNIITDQIQIHHKVDDQVLKGCQEIGKFILKT